MEYFIIKQNPPFWDKIQATFPNADPLRTAVTVGNKIYCIEEMSPDLLAHELTHVGQQLAMGVDLWWERYFTDPLFVYEQELEAYRTQLLFLYRKYKDKNKQHQLRLMVSRILGGPLYNSVKPMSSVYSDLKMF